MALRRSQILACLAVVVPNAIAQTYSTVGSSGCASQMVFLPPYTDTAVFIDNYHVNYGGPGVDLDTGAPSTTSYVYDDGSGISVFGTEYNLTSNTLRKLKPLSDTFCSAGGFFPDGTLLNVAGAEAGSTGVAEGFDKLRTYEAGPCNGACDQDWVELTELLQHYRWYPTVQTLTDGTILVVGGSDLGGLVLNEADINVPTYELVYANGSTPPVPVTLPILEFTTAENLTPGLSYNLYPALNLLPNDDVADWVFTIAGNQTIIWDYITDTLIATLPDTPLQPRSFPSSATTVLLPLIAPDYTPTVLLCGGSSGDIPNPVALDDCYTINPLDDSPEWVATDDLPNGAQTMSDGLLLPDGTVLLINGARKGSGGGFMSDDPVYEPIIYTPSADAGSRWTTGIGETDIPRLYHSVAILLPSGEVLVSGSNPAVGYSASGAVPSRWPYFRNNGHTAALLQQQSNTSFYPTEYRVEIYSPPYLASTRPVLTLSSADVPYTDTFTITGTLDGDAVADDAVVQISIHHTGFHTHGVAMGQRIIQLEAMQDGETWMVTGPRDASVLPPGMYLLWFVVDGIPSVAEWVTLA